MRFFTVLVGVFVAIFILASNNPVSAEEDVFFVSTENELAAALDQKDALNGLAISTNFYNGTTPEKQKEIDALVKHIISIKLRPVFIYGQPFDKELARKLFVEEDGSHCIPTAWAGIFPKENDTGKMCGADDNPRDELGFRKWISSYWEKTKNFFLKDRK